jgi:hypothetical protein
MSGADDFHEAKATKTMCCSKCGIAEVDDVKLKKCPDCDTTADSCCASCGLAEVDDIKLKQWKRVR